MKNRSRNFTVKRNAWGNLYAYRGNRRTKMFGESSFDAKLWIEAVKAKGHTVDASGLW